MKEKSYYFAVFEKEDESYNVYFPDFEGCCTFGNSFEHAIEMSKEALQGFCEALVIDLNEKLPEPSDITKLEVQEGQYIIPIELNIGDIKREMNDKSVRENVTVPFWES